MITNKKDLKEYLDADKKALGISRRFVPFYGGEIWKFQISLRYLEYFSNVGSIFGKFFRYGWYMIYHHYSMKLGFTIPINTCGKGLNIHHYGCIVINAGARLGENCNIQQCVNIGQNYSAENVPIIGDNVYIGPGAKIFGKITIANGCAIGAGTVVNKSFDEENSVIVGNPARVVGKRKSGLE